MRTKPFRAALGLAAALAAWPAAAPAGANPSPVIGEYRYRISGQMRLLLFWVGRDNVGTATASLRSAGAGKELSLLIGSDSQRAPRGANQWAFVREQLEGDRAQVFTVHIAGGDAPVPAEASPRDGERTPLDVMCSDVTAGQVTTATTTVNGPADFGYQHAGRLLEQLAAHTAWTVGRIPRPPRTAPGFLTAFSRMTARLAAAPDGDRAAPEIYVYKDATYALTAARVEAVAELRTARGVLRNLRRATFSTRHLRSGDITRFDATFGVDGSLAGVPVQATYQPSWWFKIRLELDAEQPGLSSDDEDALRRGVDEACSRATQSGPGEWPAAAPAR